MTHLGPFEKLGVAVESWAHNAAIVALPDGGIRMAIFSLGDGYSCAPGSLGMSTANCTGGGHCSIPCPKPPHHVDQEHDHAAFMFSSMPSGTQATGMHGTNRSNAVTAKNAPVFRLGPALCRVPDRSSGHFSVGLCKRHPRRVQVALKAFLATGTQHPHSFATGRSVSWRTIRPVQERLSFRRTVLPTSRGLSN